MHAHYVHVYIGAPTVRSTYRTGSCTGATGIARAFETWAHRPGMPMTRNLDECCTARSYYALAGAAASCAGQRSALQSRAPLAQRRREAIQLLLRKTREAYAREALGKDAGHIAFSPSPSEMVDIVLDHVEARSYRRSVRSRLW